METPFLRRSGAQVSPYITIETNRNSEYRSQSMALSEALGEPARPSVDTVCDGRKRRTVSDPVPLLCPETGSVPVDRPIIFPQKPCRRGDSMDIGGGGLHCANKAAPGVHAGVAFHAKMPPVSLLHRAHLRVPFFSAFFVEPGALISVASTRVPLRIIGPHLPDRG